MDETAKKISELIRKNRNIRTQGEIKKRLLEEYGIYTYQAKISRTVNRLDIKKGTDGFYVHGEEYRKKEKQKELRKFLKSVGTTGPAGEYMFLKTEPGFAPAVATKLKNAYPNEIHGTIAQDDIVIIIAKDEFSEVLGELIF